MPSFIELERKAHEAFRNLDEDNSGTLDPEELKVVLQETLGSDFDLADLMMLLDVNCDGQVSFDEFKAAVHSAFKDTDQTHSGDSGFALFSNLLMAIGMWLAIANSLALLYTSRTDATSQLLQSLRAKMGVTAWGKISNTADLEQWFQDYPIANSRDLYRHSPQMVDLGKTDMLAWWARVLNGNTTGFEYGCEGMLPLASARSFKGSLRTYTLASGCYCNGKASANGLQICYPEMQERGFQWEMSPFGRPAHDMMWLSGPDVYQPAIDQYAVNVTQHMRRVLDGAFTDQIGKPRGSAVIINVMAWALPQTDWGTGFSTGMLSLMVERSYLGQLETSIVGQAVLVLNTLEEDAHDGVLACFILFVIVSSVELALLCYQVWANLQVKLKLTAQRKLGLGVGLSAIFIAFLITRITEFVNAWNVADDDVFQAGSSFEVAKRDARARQLMYFGFEAWALYLLYTYVLCAVVEISKAPIDEALESPKVFANMVGRRVVKHLMRSWTIVDLVMVGLCFSTVSKLLNFIENYQEAFSGFYGNFMATMALGYGVPSGEETVMLFVSKMAQEVSVMLSLVSCVSTLRLLRFVSLVPALSLPWTAMAYSIEKLMGFVFVLVLILLSFYRLFTMLLGGSLPDFTGTQCILTLTRALFGDFDLSTLDDMQPLVRVFSKAMFILFLFLVTVALMNMLIAIIMEAYETAKEEIEADGRQWMPKNPFAVKTAIKSLVVMDATVAPVPVEVDEELELVTTNANIAQVAPIPEANGAGAGGVGQAW